MPSASFKGRRVVYGDAGVGTPVLLIHGTFASSVAWRRVLGALALDVHRALTPDLPGWGDSDSVPDDCLDVAQYQAAAVEAVLTGDAVAPVHLVAHSYGAVVALGISLAGRVPIRSLTLFEPLPVGLLSQTGDHEAFAEVTAFANAYRRAFESGEPWAARRVLDFWGGDGSFDTMSLKVREAMAAGTPQNIREWKANLEFRPTPEACRAIPVPVHVIIGAETHPITRLLSGRLCELFGHRAVVEIPAAGHFMIHTHASEVARLIGMSIGARDEARRRLL